MDSTLDTILKQVVQDIKLRFKETLVSVILFGSYARDMSEEYSDIDILVLIEKLDMNLKEKSELEFDLSWGWQEKYNKKIDLLMMSYEDALINFEIHSPLFATFVLGLKIYYDRQQLFYKNFTSFLKKLKSQNYF